MGNDGKSNFGAIVAQIIISLLLLVILFKFADVPAVFSIIAQSKLQFIAAAFLAYLLINLLMSYRIIALLSSLGSPVGFFSALRCHYLGMLASDFTPARSGYFASAFALSKYGASVSKAVSAILAPQMFDFSVKVFASVVGLAYVVSMLGIGNASILPIAAAIVVILAFVIIIAALLFCPSFAAPYLPVLKRIPFGSKIFAMLTKLSENAPVMRSNLPLILTILIISWSAKGFEWWMLSEAVGIAPNVPFHPFFFFLFLQPAVTVLQFIPTPTPAGTGVSEAGTVGILLLFGVPASSALAFGILTRAIMLAQDWVGLIEWRSLNLDFLDENKW